MKILKSIPLILFILSGCKPKVITSIPDYPDHEYYHLHGNQTGFESDYEDEFYAFGVQLDLTTDYDSLPDIHFMTCSWADDLGHTSDTTFYIGYHSCDANFQSSEHITSKDTLRFLSVIVTPRNNSFHPTKIKVGISLVDTVKIPWTKLNFGDLTMTKEEHDSIKSQFIKLANSQENIVWSNAINLTAMDNPITHSGSVDLICGEQTTHEHCK